MHEECSDYFAIACSAPRKRALSARTTHRTTRMVATNITPTMDAAKYGWVVASQVMDTASASSPKLRVMFESGSGEGVTAARAAVLPPCAARAMAPPAAVAASCCQGLRDAVA